MTEASKPVGPEAAQAVRSVEVRKRRLLFRCWHRGTKESDLLLGSFAQRYVSEFGIEQLDRLEALLERSDPDIYNWMTDREPPPLEHDNDVMALLKNHKDSFARR